MGVRQAVLEHVRTPVAGGSKRISQPLAPVEEGQRETVYADVRPQLLDIAQGRVTQMRSGVYNPIGRASLRRSPLPESHLYPDAREPPCGPHDRPV
jgi:hypothetical protein